MNGNFIQIVQMMQQGNPRMILQMIRKQSGNNPIIDNALNMFENGDSKGVEELARNLCKEKGIDPDEAINRLKNIK